MYLKLGKIRIHITFAFAAFAAFAANSDAGERLTLIFASALLHECVHLCFLIGYGCRNIRLTLRPGGAAISCAGTELLNARKSVPVFLSAPLMNAVLGAALFFLAGRFSSEALLTAARINLRLGAVNLLPVSFLDGGRALKAVLDARKSEAVSLRVSAAADAGSLTLLAAYTATLALTRRPWGGAAVFTGYCLVFGGKHIFRKLLKK